MWKAAVVVTIGILILLLQLQFREPFYPFHIEPVLPSSDGADSLEQLYAEDLDNNGVDDIFEIRVKKNSHRYIVFSELGRGGFLGKGDRQKNFLLSLNVMICGIFLANEDGEKALYLRESDTTGVLIRKCRYDSLPSMICEYRKPRRCYGKRWHEPGLSVVGAYRDEGRPRSLLVCGLDVSACDKNRRYFLIDPSDPSRILNVYHMGAHLGSAVLRDTDADRMPELFLFCGSTSNGISTNGTADSCGYVIALDHNLRELWQSKLGTDVTVYGTLCANERGMRLVAGLNHDTDERASMLYLFDAVDGTLLDSLATEGRIEAVGRAWVTNGHTEKPIVATNSRGIVLSLSLAEDRIKADRKQFGNTRTCIIGALETSNPPFAGIIIGDRASGNAYLGDSKLRTLCLIKSRTGTMPAQFFVIHRTDGAERLLYREGNGVLVSRMERSSIVRYAATNFWGVIAYTLLAISFATIRRARKPDALEGKLKLLEHMRVSAFHGRLSLVKSLERLARLIEMIGQTKMENTRLVNQFETELRAFRSKWGEDLALIIAISGDFGLYKSLVPELRSQKEKTGLILERSQSAINARETDGPARLIRNAEELKAIYAKLTDALGTILGDLDKTISCDAIAIAQTTLNLFRAREEGAGVAYSLSTHDRTELHVRMLERDLYTILDNMLSNALRAVEGSDNREIELVILCMEHHASIAVRDTGCGIDPDTLPVLFDLGTTTKHSGGTGLYFVRKTVERYGGMVSAKSEGLGKGAEISFTVPLVLTLTERTL